MKKLSLVFALIFFSASLALAQRTISGVVSDEQGEPLYGASVLVTGTTVGTTTDFDGKYSINVPTSATSLEISYTGFTTQEVAIGASNVLDVTLAEGILVSDVVVTASGIERNARDVVYANQTVTGEDLLSTPSKNALEALRGKASGVRLSTGSGSVGASTKIVLRGESSLTGDNNALFVVDGIPIDNSTSIAGAGTSTAGYADHGNRFNDINPDDIENITILKGPSATSLYGSRGAAGVVLITTKKGKKGKMKIGVNSTYSTEKAYVLLQRQNKFGQGYDNAHYDSGENWSWGPSLDGTIRPWTSPVDTDGDGALEALTRPYSAVDNQLQEFFNLGQTVSNSFYLSGAKEGFTYYASFSNANQKGTLDNTFYKRNTGSFNASAQLSEKLRSDFKVSYAHINQNTAQEGSRAFEGNNAYAMVIQSPVNIPFGELRDYKSPFHDINGYWGSYSSVNPYFILNEYGNDGKINNFLGNASLTYTPIKNLELKGQFGTNVVNTGIETWAPPVKPAQQLVWVDDFQLTTRNSRQVTLGSFSKYAKQATNLDFRALANYKYNINDNISLDLTGGYDWFQRGVNSVTGETNGGLVVSGWYNLKNSASASRSSQYESLYRIYGTFGSLRLGYKNALFLEYNARNDVSSTLPKKNNSFFYQSIGVSTVLTDLLEMERNNYLSFAKLRLSYGTTGKDAGLYLLDSYFVGNPDLVGLGDYTINLPLNGQPGFTTGNKIGNPDLKPELTTTLEVGADLGFLKERVNLSYTYYSSVHSNQIVEISLPRSTGFTQTISNIGEMTNKGHELSLTLKPIEGLVKGLSWELFGSFSKNDNKVVKITDDISELVIGGPYTPGVSLVAKEGLPFGTFKALAPMEKDGKIVVDSVTGFPLYTDNEVYLGSYQPDYIMSYGTNISYKGFGFNILFDSKKGGNFVSQTQFYTEFNGTAAHTAEHNREPYVFPNSIKQAPDGSYVPNDIEITEQDYFTNYDPAASTYLVDASYLKLREIGLSYVLPKKLISGMSISNARISVFGKNIKFWLPKENIFADPEVNGPGLTGNAAGIETTQVPPSKSYGINLNLTF